MDTNLRDFLLVGDQLMFSQNEEYVMNMNKLIYDPSVHMIFSELPTKRGLQSDFYCLLVLNSDMKSTDVDMHEVFSCVCQPLSALL